MADDENAGVAPADAVTETPQVDPALVVDTPNTEDGADLLVEFIGDPAQHPLEGCINGAKFAYPYGEPVRVPAHVLEVIEGANYLFKSLPPEVPTEGGAALPDASGQGDAGDLSGSGGSDDLGVNLETLLDKSVAEVIAALPELATEQLTWLLNAETNGKTRKSLLEALEKALAPAA